MRYRFGDFELDSAAYALCHRGREVMLQPKMFDLLRFLLEQRERVVPKRELLDAVWSGEQVGESAVAWTISHVREALGQSRTERTPIETVHGRGYRFRSPVVVLEPDRSERVSSSRGEPTPPRSSPFVGRAEVMRRLESLLADADQGQGRSVILGGEAGIGKTRCAAELLERARSRNFRTWSGRAVEGGSAPSFWPFIQVLRDTLTDCPALRDRGDKLLGRLYALDSSRREVEPPASSGRFLLLDEMSGLILQAANDQRAVVLIDDLQWADAGTLDLFAFMASELSGSSVLLLGTDRDPDGEGARPLAHGTERIELSQLTAMDIAGYIAELTQKPAPKPQLAEAVLQATAGNPLFVQETVRVLVAAHGEAALATLEPTAIAPPEIARNVLRQRLEALPTRTRELLAQASVLGEEIDLSLLHELSELELSVLLGRLEPAMRHGLIVRETQQRYRYAHTLIRELLYEDMHASDRVALHLRAADALELRPSTRDNELSHHLYRALPLSNPARVTWATRKAAAAASAVHAYDDAARYYGWALEAQAQDPNAKPRDRAELLLATGSAERFAGRDADARRTLSRLFEQARAHGFADLLVRGARRLRPTFAMATLADPLVREALESVLALTQDEVSPDRSHALSQLACVPPYSLDLERSKQLSASALELSRECSDESALHEALRARLYSLSGPDDIDALIAAADEISKLPTARPDYMQLEASSALYGAFIHRGEIARADQELDRIGRLALELNMPETIWYHHRQTAQRRMLDGHFALAETAAPSLRARGERIGLSYAGFFVDVIERARVAEISGWEVAGKSLDINALMLPISTLHFPLAVRLTRIAAVSGRGDLARIGLEALSADGFHAVPKEIGYLHALGNLAMAAIALSDTARAEQLYALLSPYPQHNTPDGLLLYEGSVSRFLALLAASTGRDDEVEPHFEAALAMAVRMGHKPAIARIHFELASYLADRGGSRNRKQSRELAQRAHALSDELGMQSLASSARLLLS